MLMSAGSSPAGRKFAVNNVDCLFMVITEESKIASDVAAARAVPGADKVGLYASGHLLCRRTPKETEEYYHYLVREKGDWEAAEQIVASAPPAARSRCRRSRCANPWSGSSRAARPSR